MKVGQSIFIQFDQGPVLGELVGLDRDLDRIGVKHESNGALVRGGTAPGDLAMERVHLLDHLRRLRHHIHVFLTLLGNFAVLSLDELPQPFKYVVPGVDVAEEIADGTNHGLDGVAVGLVAGCDELVSSLACVRTRHARVGVDRRGTGDVGAGQHGSELVVLA